MTITDWRKKEKVLLSGQDVVLPSGAEIIVLCNRAYGREYSLRAKDGNTILCSWDLNQIKDLVL